MIYSPLEQFNILSLYDFSLVNISNFAFIYAKLLLWISYAFTLIINAIEPLSNLFASLLPIISTFSFFLVYSCGSFFSHYVPVLDFYNLFYFDILSSIWYLLFHDYGVIFTTHPLFVFLSNSNNLVSSTYTSSFLSFNISLISSSFGLFLTSIYFIVLELWLSITGTIYAYTIEPLFYLTTKDFSYLILSLNSSSIWISLGFLVTTFLLTTSLRTVTLIPQNNWQTILESLYATILNVVSENAGPKNVKFFPLIFTTFLVVLVSNLLGMIPYSFTVTSHLIVTFSMALAIFVGMNILGILKHGKHFLSLFFPPGAPLQLSLLLVIIEFISYVFRVFSLSIRLFANLMSGHTLLKILSGFAWVTVSFWGIFLIPVLIIFLITGLELMIACLQAYIFVVLLCIYINDAINLH